MRGPGTTLRGWAVVLALHFLTADAFAYDASYIAPEAVDLVQLLVPPPAFAICAGCDHFMRDTSPSGWFDLLAELSLPLPEGER